MTDLGPQWDMRVTPAKKVGGQGTLFGSQGTGTAPHLSDAARYPRGYTPERRRMVEGVMEREHTEHFGPGNTRQATKHVLKDPAEQVALTKAGNKATCPACKGTGIEEGSAPTHKDTGRPVHELARSCWNCSKGNHDLGTVGEKSSGVVPVSDDRYWLGERGKLREAEGRSGSHGPQEFLPKGHTHPYLHAQGRHDIVEALARSTVPEEHLRRINRIAVTNDKQVGRAAGYANGFGEIGLQTNSRSRDTSVHTKEKAATTLIHEIGHTSGAQGGNIYEDEAKADAYMLQHHRPDPRSSVNEVRGSRYLYSGSAGDRFDPDKVTAPGETEQMRQTRLGSGLSDQARKFTDRRHFETKKRAKQLPLFDSAALVLQHHARDIRVGGKKSAS